MQDTKRPRTEAGVVAPLDKGDRTNIAQDLVDFINYAWTPFHAVEAAAARLSAAGYQHINERLAWNIQPGGKYFFTRNMSTIVAFAVGKKFQPGNGFYMVGAHTDSPCLKLKPVSKSTKSGYLMLNAECYGGGLWYTWYDRDLSLAGRVVVRSPAGSSAAAPVDGGVATAGAAAPPVAVGLEQRLVRIDRPLLRIPMLAIHLQRDYLSAGFKPNLQTNFAPVLATAAKAALAGAAPGAAAVPAPAAAAAAEVGGTEPKPAVTEEPRHHALLVQLLATELGVAPADIVDFELHVCDVQPGVIGGLCNEFIFVGRLDNLAMSYVALTALLDSTAAADALDDETGVRAVALFDHEEVGSDSAQGAGGPVMRDTITRVASALSQGEEGAVERTLRSSFLISADMAHALHPNYSDKHDPDHQPRIHGGLVVKTNANQRYATNALSAVIFREVGRLHGIPCQEFSVRNDTPCGSTIGPILASNLGCRTVDIGIPQLSMHSIREQCGVDDVGIAHRHLLHFYQDMSRLDATLDVDSLPPAQSLGELDDVPCDHIH